MDPLHFAIAVTPLAVYLFALARIQLRSRPTIVGGMADHGALALAIAGLVVVGPMELFLPETAAAQYGPMVWGWMLSLYALSALLVVLSARPRIVVYNVLPEDMRPWLSVVGRKLDEKAYWAGDTFVLPNLVVQLHLEPTVSTRVLSLVSSGPRQSQAGWSRLVQELADTAPDQEGTLNPQAIPMAIAAWAMLAIVALWLLKEPAATATALRDMLRW